MVLNLAFSCIKDPQEGLSSGSWSKIALLSGTGSGKYTKVFRSNSPVAYPEPRNRCSFLDFTQYSTAVGPQLQNWIQINSCVHLEYALHSLGWVASRLDHSRIAKSRLLRYIKVGGYVLCQLLLSLTNQRLPDFKKTCMTARALFPLDFPTKGFERFYWGLTNMLHTWKSYGVHQLWHLQIM